MEALKRYLIKNFEQIFALLILLSVAGITYFVPYKLAFLNFYFIPILVAAYYLGVRKALLGGVLCTLMVAIYAYLFPESFMIQLTVLDLWMNIMTWASFLILTAAVVGQVTTRLKVEVEQVTDLNRTLEESTSRLEAADAQLRDHAENLEKKVTERTESLERSKTAVEDLKKRVEEALYSTMDASVVKLIIEKRLRTEKRKISILFSDLKDFTAFSEDFRPEVVITDLNRLLEEMEKVLLDYKAHIDKYLGDGIMVEFGAPNDYERHALLAVVAGLKMQEAILQEEFPWQMRIGIATGEPIIGLIGHKRQTYTAIGSVVNLASRIQELCVPGLVTIDAATYDEVFRLVEARKKTIYALGDSEDPKFVREVEEYSKVLDEKPEELEILKKLGMMFLKGNYMAPAQEHLGRALQLNPDDNEIKLAYAESTLKMNQEGSVAIRGMKTKLTLYEVTGLRNLLTDREVIPQKLYDRYVDEVEKAADYNEDIILPVEAMDGSIGHSRVVGFLSYALADTLNLEDQEKVNILRAGYVSDLGKLIIPHHLLNRAGGLNRDEFEQVTKHPRESVRVLKKLGFQGESLFQIIENSHEAFDGSGYPNGLSGEEIPIGGRIVNVVDAYISLTSWRPYRDRWEHRAAFAELKNETEQGKFDPEVIKALGRLLEV